MTRWNDLVRSASQPVSDNDVDMARRALDYLCLAQLYLKDNFLLSRPLQPTDIAERPAGHWGVCPPVNTALAAIGPYRQFLTGIDVHVVHGAGHAGPSALAQAWITGALEVHGYRRDLDGLRRLVTGFRQGHEFGTEITPLIPGHDHLGGQLGPALAISQGMALDAPHRLVISLIGDGECETGATAAVWLGARALAGTGAHGRVLPVILLNGLRMGSASLLSTLPLTSLQNYFSAPGYRVVVTANATTAAIRAAFREALSQLQPLQNGPSVVLVITAPKGNGAPIQVADRPILGTPKVHKTPLTVPRTDPDEFSALVEWFASYHPEELFEPDATPASAIFRALGRGPREVFWPPEEPQKYVEESLNIAKGSRTRSEDFGAAITRVLSDLNNRVPLRVFSPDELASNRINLGNHQPKWVVEVLNEELCHAWAQGYQHTGRRAIVITYEAFAPIAASLLTQQLLQRRIAAKAGRPAMPSMVYLLTSLGWHNTISHANPGLIDIAVGSADPAVHIYTPADTARTAATVASAVHYLGECSIVVASKHPMPNHSLDTLTAELRDGYAVWPHIADSTGPELILMSAGDIAAHQLTTAAAMITAARPSTQLRYLNIHDLCCLGSPKHRAAAIPPAEFAALLPENVPVLAAVLCHPTIIYGLLGERGALCRVIIRGWLPQNQPLTHQQLLRHNGIDAHSLTSTALQLLDPAPPQTAKESKDARPANRY